MVDTETSGTDGVEREALPDSTQWQDLGDVADLHGGGPILSPDIDGDESVSYEEIVQSYPDLDGDGRVSYEEVATANDAHLAAYDLNEDGAVSKVEDFRGDHGLFDAYAEAAVRKPGLKGRVDKIIHAALSSLWAFNPNPRTHDRLCTP